MSRTSRGRHASVRRLAVLTAAVYSLGFASAVGAVDDVDLHDLTWYVHADLVTVTEDVAYWQGILETATAQANALIEGDHGPADTPCCSRLTGAVSVSVFGSPGDGYDILDTPIETSTLNNFGGAGSNAYLVDSITYCGGFFPNSVGCASTPVCTGNGNDDPNLWMAVTVDSLDSATLPLVVAHERGHNACLNHPAAPPASDECQIMQGTITNPGLGGCFTASECSNFRDARTTTSSGEQCACHGTGGVPEADGSQCSVAPIGVCSGGLCGGLDTDAVVKLVSAAHPGSASVPAPDDALMISALTGAWTDSGPITPSAQDVQGLAYSEDASILYGVVPTTGDDSIVTVDADTGDRIATIGSIANGAAELISMAYDPGATPTTADDRLYMLEVSQFGGAIVWIDPASPTAVNLVGFLNVGPASAFQGLAYDSAQGKLFASSPFGPDGLYEIDCPPAPCNASQVVGANALFVDDGSLTYSPDTGMLYQIGTSFSGTRTFYNVIDPTNGASLETLSLDVFTPGALAAVPEPGLSPGILAGLAGLFWAGRRKRRSATRTESNGHI